MRCDRCMEQQIDRYDTMVPVIDYRGEHLIIHVTCIVEDDDEE